MASGGPTIEFRVGGGDKEWFRELARRRGFVRRGGPDMSAYLLDLIRRDAAGAVSAPPPQAGPALSDEDRHCIDDARDQLRRIGTLVNQLAKAANTVVAAGGKGLPEPGRICDALAALERMSNHPTAVEKAALDAMPEPPEPPPRRRGRSRPVEE